MCTYLEPSWSCQWKVICHRRWKINWRSLYARGTVQRVSVFPAYPTWDGISSASNLLKVTSYRLHLVHLRNHINHVRLQSRVWCQATLQPLDPLQYGYYMDRWSAVATHYCTPGHHGVGQMPVPNKLLNTEMLLQKEQFTLHWTLLVWY